MSKLDEIIEVKRGEIEQIRPRLQELRELALQRDDIRPFALALERGEGELGLIAEVKKASPSAGIISEDFDPVQIARAYESSGAHAISVLTDEQFFQGSLDFLRDVREAVSLPVLRKDFIIDEVQVYEAAAAGADAVLLIVAALPLERLLALMDAAEACQLDVLVEVHTLQEMEIALDAQARLIGINNRNLKTFEVDLNTTQFLSEEVPDEIVLVSESGIRDGEQTSQLISWGVDAILVGESLMRANDLDKSIQDLLQPPKRADARVIEP